MQDYFIYNQITNNYKTMIKKEIVLKNEIYNIEKDNIKQSNEKLKELKIKLNILRDEIIFFESNIICYL